MRGILMRILVIVALIVSTIYLGILSSLFIKPILLSWGFEKNWCWPLICLMMGAGVGIIFRQKSSRRSLPTVIAQFSIGLLIGIAIQMGFVLVGQRSFPSFHDFSITAIFFQVLVSFAEEYVFRGKFQSLLQDALSYPVATLIISIPFATVHGLNPILFKGGSFDWGWFVGTLVLSITAGLAFGPKRLLSRAFGAHLAYNIIATFF